MEWHIEADALGAMGQALLSSATLLDECPSPASGIVPANQGELVARVAPVCELLYLMMIADGRCGPKEQEVLRGAANVLGAGQLRADTIEGLMDDFKHRHDELGSEAQLDAVTAWLSADKLVAEAAFTMTAVMALADDQIEPREEALLRDVAERLGITDQRASQLLGAAHA